MSYRTGWGYSKEFFNATDTRNFFAGFHNAMEMEVEKMSDSEIVSCNFDEWANYLATKYSVIPISIFETNIERRLTEAKVKRANPFRGAPYERDYFEVDGVRITFKIPYDGEPKLFEVRPSTFIMSRFSTRSFVAPHEENCGSFTLEFEYTKQELQEKGDAMADYVQRQFEHEFESYKKMIEYVNAEVLSYNDNLHSAALRLLEKRKKKADSFSNISAALQIPLTVSKNAPNTKPIELKRIVRQPPSKPKVIPAVPEHYISDADYENINNIISLCGTTMEKTARTYYANTEEELRDHLLATLNTHYCNQFFVSKGMIVDFAIHDPKPPGHNPHCHVMLTMRAMDEHGKWLPKARKVYDLDENGERIRLPSGNWKSHKEDTVDWNEQYHGQEWRTGWETVQNRYLEMVNSPVRVDLRSYEKQGLDIIPTVHMGAAVTQMERRGIQTNIGNLNRDIKAANRMMSVIRSTIQNLRDWISDILEARKELLAEKNLETASPDLINLLRDYLNLRKAERRDWSRYGQQKGATKDLQSFVNATNYLKEYEIFTLEQLDSVLEEVKQKSGSISTSMKKAESRMKVITGIQNAVADCQQHKAIHDKYVRIGWKTVQSVYAESHRDELDTYNKAYRFLKKHGVDLNVDLKALQAEYEQLQTSHAEYTGQLAAVQEELKPLKEIRYWVSKVLAPEQAEVKKKPEPKHSVTEQIQDYREESRKKDEQHRQEKKQNMEL